VTGVTTQLPVRFAQCDPAGIAYYPALFELCDAAIEQWTGAVIGVSRKAMHEQHRLALPTVTMQADFSRTVAWGDALDITIETRRVGTSSVDIAAIARCGGERRFAVTYRQVLMTMDGHSAQPWPDDWRARLLSAVEREGSAA